jgi:hypothetical protein
MQRPRHPDTIHDLNYRVSTATQVAPYDRSIPALACTPIDRLVYTENWPELVALTSVFSVELPGIEPDLLSSEMLPELQFHYVSIRFSPAHYPRFRLGS